MSLLLTTALVTGVLVVVVGLGPARALGDSRSTVALLAPAVTGLACSTAVALALLTRTSLVPWLVALCLAGWAVGLRRRSPLDPTIDDGRVLVVVAVVALLPLLLVDYPATVGDARSNFWFHAAWFRAGGGPARDAMASPAYEYTHPAYPPLVPAVIATVWHAWHSYDRHVALRVGQLLTAYGAAALAFFTTRVLRVSGRVGLLLAAGIVWLAWSVKLEVGLQGLLDLTWALPVATAAVLVLAGDGTRRTVLWAAVFVAMGAFTKTEGQVAALVLVAVAALRFRRQWRSLAPLAGAVAVAIGLWALVVRPSANDRGDWSQVTTLGDPGSEVNERLGASISRLVSEIGPLVFVGAALVVAIVVLVRWAGQPVRQPGLLTLLVVAAGYTAFTAVLFSVRPEEIDFLLSTAAYRTTIFVRLVVVVDVVLALVTGARALGWLPVPLTTGVDPGHRTDPAPAGRVPG